MESQLGITSLLNTAPKTKLTEVFAPFFSLIIQLRETSEYGDSDLLRSRVLELLKNAEGSGIKMAIPAADIKDARFAVVAFLDETIIGSEWSEKMSWIAKPLQVQLYGQAVAGKEFFERLDRIKADAVLRHSVLEVYYLCLALGFKGKYQVLGAAGQNELLMQIESSFQRLNETAEKRDSRLSPHGVPGDQVVTEVKSKLPPWMIAVTAASVGLVVYIVLAILMNSSVSRFCTELAGQIEGGCG